MHKRGKGRIKRDLNLRPPSLEACAQPLSWNCDAVSVITCVFAGIALAAEYVVILEAIDVVIVVVVLEAIDVVLVVVVLEEIDFVAAVHVVMVIVVLEAIDVVVVIVLAAVDVVVVVPVDQIHLCYFDH